MKNTEYEIGYDLFSLFPAGLALFVFGGATVLLKLKNNEMFIFTGLLTILYSHFFMKLCIDENGFYYKHGIKKARYYQFSDIKEAWESSGKARTGVINHYLNFKTDDGTVRKISFTADKAEGIHFLINRVMDEKTDGKEQSY